MNISQENLKFEKGVLRFVSSIGTLRLFYELYNDLTIEISIFFWLMDFALLMVFLLTFVLERQERVKADEYHW